MTSLNNYFNLKVSLPLRLNKGKVIMFELAGIEQSKRRQGKDQAQENSVNIVFILKQCFEQR